MIRAVAALLFAVGLTFLLASPSLAFDGKRKGFILGFGLGPSFTSTAEKLEFTGFPEETRNHSNLGAATDFRIGFGATERLLIYYNNKVSWFGLEQNIIASGLTSLALSYYTRPDTPSGYFTGGIGAAGFRNRSRIRAARSALACSAATATSSRSASPSKAPSATGHRATSART